MLLPWCVPMYLFHVPGNLFGLVIHTIRLHYDGGIISTQIFADISQIQQQGATGVWFWKETQKASFSYYRVCVWVDLIIYSFFASLVPEQTRETNGPMETPQLFGTWHWILPRWKRPSRFWPWRWSWGWSTVTGGVGSGESRPQCFWKIGCQVVLIESKIFHIWLLTESTWSCLVKWREVSCIVSNPTLQMCGRNLTDLRYHDSTWSSYENTSEMILMPFLRYSLCMWIRT